MKWFQYFAWEDTEKFNRLDYYLAQIAQVVEQGHVKNPERVTIDSKLLKFEEEKEKEEDLDEDQQQLKIQNSKNYWLSGLGLKDNGKLKTRTPPKKLNGDKKDAGNKLRKTPGPNHGG